MITEKEMRKAIKSSISSQYATPIVFGRGHFSSKRVPLHSLYAAFVYASIAKAMQDAGWTVTPMLHSDEFVFSLGRSNITSTKKTFSYIIFCNSRKRSYELHCGLNVQSKVVGVNIEVDALVIPKSHGIACRKDGKQIDHNELKTLIEVKHYQRRFDISKAKEFIGTCSLVREQNAYAALVTKEDVTSAALKLFNGLIPPIATFQRVDLAGATSMARTVTTELRRIIT